MTLELLKTLLFFLTGAFLVFLAITITRDNFANRLNRVTGAMLLFAGMGPIFVALGKMVDPMTTTQVAFEQTSSRFSFCFHGSSPLTASAASDDPGSAT
jgi:hypothetical protein